MPDYDAPAWRELAAMRHEMILARLAHTRCRSPPHISLNWHRHFIADIASVMATYIRSSALRGVPMMLHSLRPRALHDSQPASRASPISCRLGQRAAWHIGTYCLAGRDNCRIHFMAAILLALTARRRDADAQYDGGNAQRIGGVARLPEAHRACHARAPSNAQLIAAPAINDRRGRRRRSARNRQR